MLMFMRYVIEVFFILTAIKTNFIVAIKIDVINKALPEALRIAKLGLNMPTLKAAPMVTLKRVLMTAIINTHWN